MGVGCQVGCLGVGCQVGSGLGYMFAFVQKSINRFVGFGTLGLSYATNDDKPGDCRAKNGIVFAVTYSRSQEVSKVTRKYKCIDLKFKMYYACIPENFQESKEGLRVCARLCRT